MRLGGLLVVGAVICAAEGVALAQSQVCSKNAPNVRWTVAQKNADGSFTTFADQTIGNLINAAECACDSQDLFLVGRVFSAINTLVTPQAWAGSSCNVVIQQPTSCEQVTATVTPSNFFPGSGTAAGPAQQVPVRALISPRTNQDLNNPDAGADCPSAASVPNSVWILFPFDPANPDYCSVLLTAKTSLPAPATDLVVASGDRAITLTWNSPPFGTADLPVFFQVLCADEFGQPIAGQGAYGFNQPADKPHQLAYTTCVDPANHTIERRFLGTSGNPGDGLTPDGGVAATGFGFAALSTEPEQATVVTDDAGAAPTPSAASLAALATFDQKFVVSDPLRVLTTDNRIRVENAVNNVTYTCVVLAIDNWGNPNPSNFAAATTSPVENFYRRFLDEGGQPQGFCFIATAAYGSAQHPYVRILRRFRDQSLLPTPMGRAFVEWYYRTSPPLARWIEPRPTVRMLVRILLWPLIAFAWFHLNVVRWQLLIALAIGLKWIARWRRSRKKQHSVPTKPDLPPVISAGGAA